MNHTMIASSKIELSVTLLHGGFLLYQCIRNDSEFRCQEESEPLKFTSSNGLLIGSSKSPYLYDLDDLGLPGINPTEDHTPIILKLSDFEDSYYNQYEQFCKRVQTAINELNMHLAKQRIQG